jgi:Na+/H+ antiporter NhaD/arsenite permease-like protein
LDWAILTVFALVYLGMFLGRLPGLALDRTGIALLGAIALIALGRIEVHAAWAAIDVGTIALLLGMMVVSAALQRAGFYDRTVARIAALDTSPVQLLGLVILAAGALSAVLTNDVVCIAMAPLVVHTAAGRGLAPLPYLLGLACAANVGSAATLIGNPQNMLIGQSLRLDFGAYLADAALPSSLGLVVTWAVIAAVQRGRWRSDVEPRAPTARPHDRFDATKTLLVLAVVVALFLATDWPREVVALGAAGVVLVSRRSRSRDVLALVDWQLLVLFAGLFVVNATLESSGMLAQFVAWSRARGVDPSDPTTLFLVTVPLSSLVSNVPAVMLLLPTATHPQAGAVLALAGTLAGNLFLVGSIANLIVADQAARLGVPVGAREHARIGVPVALLTLALAAAWLALRA